MLVSGDGAPDSSDTNDRPFGSFAARSLGQDTRSKAITAYHRISLIVLGALVGAVSPPTSFHLKHGVLRTAVTHFAVSDCSGAGKKKKVIET